MRRLASLRAPLLLGAIALLLGAARSSAADRVAATGTAPPTAIAPPAEHGEVMIRPGALEALAKIGKVGTLRPPAAKGGRAQLMRTGFRVNKAGGEVVIQTSSAVELQSRSSTGSGDSGKTDRVVFVLKGCRATRRTDRLPLDTRFFKSPVTRVSLRQRGADLEVVVALRGGATPVTRKEAGPSGSWFWVLGFPADGVASDGPGTTTASAAP